MKIKPWMVYAIGASVIGVSIGTGVIVSHVSTQDVGLSLDWPIEGAGLSSMNDAGTLACDAPIDGVDADLVDGYYWGDACPSGSGILTSSITGRADPGAKIDVWRNNRAILIGSTTASPDGTWTIPGTIIPEGRQTIVVEAVKGRNASTISQTIFIDTTPPTWSDVWDPPDWIDPASGVFTIGCECPTWCENPWTELMECPGGYKCGTAGDCHTEYTSEQAHVCKASRRAGCLTISTPQVIDNFGVRLIEIHTATYNPSGEWKVYPGGAYLLEHSSNNSTTTRFYTNGYTDALRWVVGDVVLLEDIGDCALTSDEERAVSVRGSNYIDITPAASADLDKCAIHNLSRVVILDDPIGFPPWDLVSGMTLKADTSTRTPIVNSITGAGPWSITFLSPYWDHAPTSSIQNGVSPSMVQEDSWWNQIGFPSWVEASQCVIPPNVVDSETGGPATCVPKSEWH